jgi:hypothetical protein
MSTDERRDRVCAPYGIARRVSTLGSVIQALETVLSGEQPQRNIVSRRYTEGLFGVPRSSVVRLLAELRIYSEAVQEARSSVTALSVASGTRRFLSR